jgi:hypothetical protein
MMKELAGAMERGQRGNVFFHPVRTGGVLSGAGGKKSA